MSLAHLVLLSAAATISFSASLSAAEDRCPDDGTDSAQVVSVDERLDLTLDNGSRLKIAGIDPPRPTPLNPDLDSRAREQLSQWLSGQTVRFAQLAPRTDRWGRIVAFVYAAAGQADGSQRQARLSVAEALIDAGLARYEPSAAAHPCRSALLAAERGARALHLGLWADPYYAVIAASDGDALAEKAGSSVIVEGRVSATAERRPRLMLYFGPRKRFDLSVTMFARSSKAFEAARPILAGLAGTVVRVRGFLDTRFGPQIEISDVDAVEPAAVEQGLAGAGESNR